MGIIKTAENTQNAPLKGKVMLSALENNFHFFLLSIFPLSSKEVDQYRHIHVLFINIVVNKKFLWPFQRKKSFRVFLCIQFQMFVVGVYSKWIFIMYLVWLHHILSLIETHLRIANKFFRMESLIWIFRDKLIAKIS